MALDLQKRLERARRNLEKNKLRDAVEEYQAVLSEAPGHQEALQALADLYTRLNEPARAAEYYAAQFDRLVEAGDAAKATAIFTRFLQPFPQPPERLMRYGALLQKQNRSADAIEQFTAAADLFAKQEKDADGLACYQALARLDSENPERHATLGEMAERLGRPELAAPSYVRAGQLHQAAAAPEKALDYFGRAHRLQPADRTSALLFAEANLRKGDAGTAVATLEPLAAVEKDPPFLALFGEALVQTGHLDRAQEVLEALYKQKPESVAKLFDLVGIYLRKGEDKKGCSLLTRLKEWLFSARKDAQLMAEMDRLAADFPESVPLAETIARMYEELNRESKYFDALMRLFDLYLPAGRLKEACDTLDRLVDIDPYDFRNQERIGKLQGKADPAFLQNIYSRAAKAATLSSRNEGFSGAAVEDSEAPHPVAEQPRTQQTLDDLIVQVEIFLQYSLQAQAVERLKEIAEIFPGAEATNERLYALCERASWWPTGAPPQSPQRRGPAARGPSEAGTPATEGAASSAETHRDLAAIAEINRLMYRQPTPRDVVAAAAAEIGKHLRVTRCLLAIGAAGDAGQLTAEYFTPDVAAVGAPAIPALMALATRESPDALGGIELQGARVPALREFGLESALAAVLTDKETQTSVGTALVGEAGTRKWKPNESFFLQAVGDQLVLAVNHTRLRSLLRSLSVADEKTGLLSRSAYIDCLLGESNRARTRNAPLSLLVVQVDRGEELQRQRGEAALEQYVEQLARALSTSVRQSDIAVKYSAWTLVFVLPDTPLSEARALADRLLQAAATVRPPWDAQDTTVSAVVAQVSMRPGDDAEDRVTEWINRVEAGIEEARQRGGKMMLALATP